MRVVVAPNWLAAAVRSFFVFGAMLLVAAVMLAAKGPPLSDRDVHRNEIAHYAPRLLSGAAELGLQTIVIVAVAWGCRGFLKIRLESAEDPPVLPPPLSSRPRSD